MVRRQHRDQEPAVGARRRRGGASRRRRSRDPRRARPSAPARAECQRGRHLAPAAPDPAGGLGRAGRYRRRRAVGAHDRHGAVGRRAGRDGHRAVGWPARAARPARDRARHGGRAAVCGTAQRPAGRRLRNHAVARRGRGRRRRRRAGAAREAEGGASAHSHHRGVQFRRSGAGELRRLDVAADRRRDPRGAGGVAVPARLARDPGFGGRAAAVDPADLRRDVLHGLHAERRHASEPVARGRDPRRRRDRRDREHHATPAHASRRASADAPSAARGRSDDAGARRAEDAVPGRDGGRRRDRPRGHRHQLHADCGVPADRVHERRTGQVLRSVRLDRGDRSVLLARRRADADTDDGRLHPAQAGEGVSPAALVDDLPRLGAVVPEAPHRDPDRCCSLLFRLVRAGATAADRFHSAR